MQNFQHSRPASNEGEKLVVATLSSGEKILVDYFDRDQQVALQLHRRVALKDLPAHVRKEFRVGNYATATHLQISFLGNASGFSFDGSVRQAVCLHALPEGQELDVLPDTLCVGVRRSIPSPQLESRAYARLSEVAVA